MHVYEKIRAYIDNNGYKQVTIAEKAGIPKTTFNAIMNGKRTLYADDLCSICIALNVSPELFIEFEKPLKNVTNNEKNGGMVVVTENSEKKGEIILALNQHLRNELLNSKNKLWENTYIKRQLDKRRHNNVFSVSDHIRAMVYSMLSSGVAWDRIANNANIDTGYINSVDEIFFNYDPQQLLTCKPEQLRDDLKKIHCASQYTLKQMTALISVNITKLLSIENEYGTIDNYYSKFIQGDKTLKTLVKTLSDTMSKDKMAQMDIALICEYLRNVGYDIPKPDRHIRRVLGSNILAFSNKQTATPFEVFDIVSKLAAELNKSLAEVDYILWAYCAKGYGEICTTYKPKCDKCVAKKICKTTIGE